jgi:hypothetical protein
MDLGESSPGSRRVVLYLKGIEELLRAAMGKNDSEIYFIQYTLSCQLGLFVQPFPYLIFLPGLKK